MTAHYQQLKWT